MPVLVTPELGLLFGLLIRSGFFFVILYLLKSRFCNNTSLPSYVDIEASAHPSPRVGSLAVRPSWEESHVVETMETHVENLVAIIENVLRPITMMNVPVEDQHFLSLINCMLGSDCHVIKEAEALDILRMSVVARRARRTERISKLTRHD